MLIEEKIKKLGIELPDAPDPMANYVGIQKVGNILYLSGSGPISNGKAIMTGKIGKELTLEDGKAAAELSILNQISILKKYLGDLDKVKQIIKILGFVASDINFYNQPAVIDGASDLLIKIFDDKGKHSRSAVATPVLPFNIPVEIEMIVQIKE